MERCALHLPEVASAACKLAEAEDTTGELIEQLYRDLPSISIDYGIAEQEEDMAVVPTALEWSDVGSWRAVKEIMRRRGPLAAQAGTHVGVGTRNSLVLTSSGRLVVTVGVEGCVIVDTEDALLIVHEDSAQQVRDALEEIARRGKDEYL